MVHYYGWYSNRAKGQRRKERMPRPGDRLYWRWNLFCEPVFQPEAWDPGKMSRIAADKTKVVGHGNGSDFKICKGEQPTFFFEAGPQLAADPSRLEIEANDIDLGQEDLLQILEMKAGPVAFIGAINDFRDGDSGDELVLLGQ